MRNVGSIAILVLSLLTFIGNNLGQENQPAPTAQLQDQDPATVYIYRIDEDTVVSNLFFWFIKIRPVYFGENPVRGAKPSYRTLASIRNKEYFMLRLPSGKYIFKTRSMWGHLKVDVVAGGKYYLWVDQGNDCPSEDPNLIGPPSCEDRTASVVNVPSDRWEQNRSLLKPIKSKRVKERSLVVIPPGP